MKIKKKWAIPAALLIILIITNPSRKRFNQFSGEKDDYSGSKRTKNWIIFSVYDGYDTKYLGVFMNFFAIGPSDE